MNLSDKYFKFDNIYCIPSVHGSIDFAQLVKEAFFDIEPDCIAVELPESIMSHVLKGVKQLPYLSVVSFSDNPNVYHYVPIHPGDSIIEAVRLAVEHQTELYFVDKDVGEIDIPPVIVPDSYYLSKLGLKNYCNNYLKYIKPTALNSIHYLRETEMAFRVKKISSAYKRILFVYGLQHHHRISELLMKPYPSNISYNTIERDHISLMYIDKSIYTEVLGNMPFQTYIYEVTRKGLSTTNLGIDIPPYDTHLDSTENLKKSFYKKVNENANRLKNLTTQNNTFDQYDSLHEIFILSKKLYKREWNDQTSINRLSTALKFARNYAFVSGSLVPSPYQLIVSAKNTINDDYAYELYRLISFYPFLDNLYNLPEVTFNNNKANIDGHDVKLRPYLPMQPWTIEKIPIKKRPKEKKPGDWEKIWKSGYDLVSYPAEDIIIENYFYYLRRKARSILEKDLIITREFTTSLMDGLDIKETIRNLHLNKLYVKECLPFKGDVGTIVIIFDEDVDNKYSFHMTWYAEHQNESDLALYSTPPGKKLIGPGISQAEYGGVLSIYPPRGVKEVWSDERFNRAKTKSQKLLMAGIYYSEKKYIVYVSKIPPTIYYRSLAEQHGHHILHIPINQLSDSMIKKVKFFHFLADRRLRGIAGRYIKK